MSLILITDTKPERIQTLHTHTSGLNRLHRISEELVSYTQTHLCHSCPVTRHITGQTRRPAVLGFVNHTRVSYFSRTASSGLRGDTVHRATYHDGQSHASPVVWSSSTALVLCLLGCLQSMFVANTFFFTSWESSHECLFVKHLLLSLARAHTEGKWCLLSNHQLMLYHCDAARLVNKCLRRVLDLQVTKS